MKNVWRITFLKTKEWQEIRLNISIDPIWNTEQTEEEGLKNQNYSWLTST